MKWIIFFQNPHDRVVFTTDESNDRASLPYKKFCDNVFKYPILRPELLQKELDTFHTVYLDVTTGEWEKVEHPDTSTHSFEDMVKLNPNPEVKKQQEEEKANREVNLTKGYFENSWNKKRGGLLNDYK